MERLITIQWLRGIAALLVVWMHSVYLAPNKDPQCFQTSWGYLREFGAVGVDIFFVISGFVITISASRARSPTEFVVRRIQRVWPLYIFMTLIFVLVFPDQYSSLQDLIKSLLFLAPFNVYSPMPILAPGWSLTFELAFYAGTFFSLAWGAPARPLPERILIIIGVSVICSAVLGYMSPLHVLGNPLAIEFALGVIIAWLWLNRVSVPSWGASLLSVVGSVLVLWTALTGFGNWFYAPTAIQGPMSWERVLVWGIPCSFIVAAAALRKQQPPKHQHHPLTLLGDASYSIYLSHAIVLQFLQRHLDWLGNLHPDLMIVTATAISLAFGIAIYMLIERPLIQRRGNPVASSLSCL